MAAPATIGIFLLSLLFSKTFAEMIDFRTDSQKFFDDEVNVNYETCDHEFYDYNYDDEYTYENDYTTDESYEYEEGLCHRSKVPTATIQERYGDDVPSCCDIHGYMTNGKCDGNNKQVWIELSYKEI